MTHDEVEAAMAVLYPPPTVSVEVIERVWEYISAAELVIASSERMPETDEGFWINTANGYKDAKRALLAALSTDKAGIDAGTRPDPTTPNEGAVASNPLTNAGDEVTEAMLREGSFAAHRRRVPATTDDVKAIYTAMRSARGEGAPRAANAPQA